MIRPSFQFYPADWQANSNLRRCTHEEKGLWVDVLCLLHDQQEYGVARWPLAEIAQAIGATAGKLRGLVSKGVLKGADGGEVCSPLVYTPRSGRKNGPSVTLIEPQEGPVWFSSRMVEDEHKRVARADTVASPKPSPNQSPKGGFGVSPKDTPKRSPDHSPISCAGASRAAPSSSSSSSSSSTNVRTKTKAPAASSFDPKPDLFAHGVAEQTIVDWLALRAKKRAPVTPTVLSRLLREAAAAGMSLDATLALCCVRGWTGFEATWVQKDSRGAPAKFNATAHVNRNRKSNP